MGGEITFAMAATSYGVCLMLVLSFLMTFGKGRDLIHRALSLFFRKPIEVGSLFVLLSALTIVAGTKGGAVVTEDGIKLTSVRQTPESISMEWTTEDDRIKPGSVFNIQEYRGQGYWCTMASTTNFNCTIPKFTISEHHQWRIMTDITEDEK